MSGNQVADVSGLAGAQRLDELWLGRNPLTDITPLTALPALTGVDLEGVDPATPGVAELRTRGVFVGGFADPSHLGRSASTRGAAALQMRAQHPRCRGAPFP